MTTSSQNPAAKVTATVETITPELATLYLARRNRNITAPSVQYRTNAPEMLRGRFIKWNDTCFKTSDLLNMVWSQVTIERVLGRPDYKRAQQYLTPFNLFDMDRVNDAMKDPANNWKKRERKAA